MPTAPPVALVTGATSGVGEATACALSAQGYEIAAVGREAGRLSRSLDAIRRAGGPPPRGFLADLLLQSEVIRLAAEVRAAIPHLDVLVNNAGAIFTRREETAEGMERTFALNVAGPFRLTRELLPLLRTAKGRVVNVSSAAHRTGRLHWDDLDGRRGFGGWRAYSQSKLALLVLTREFARREPAGGVTFNACHPGFVRSRFAQNNRGPSASAVRFLAAIGGISPQKGAETVVFLASSRDVEGRTGEYWAKCRARSPSPRARDPDAGPRLWSALEGQLPGGRSADGPGPHRED